jgi:hypothetical protein
MSRIWATNSTHDQVMGMARVRKETAIISRPRTWPTKRIARAPRNARSRASAILSRIRTPVWLG